MKINTPERQNNKQINRNKITKKISKDKLGKYLSIQRYRGKFITEFYEYE